MHTFLMASLEVLPSHTQPTYTPAHYTQRLAPCLLLNVHKRAPFSSKTLSASFVPLYKRTVCVCACVCVQGRTGDRGYRGNPRWADGVGMVQNTGPLNSPPGPRL